MARATVRATAFWPLLLVCVESSLTVVDDIDGDDLFNTTTGLPGTCTCEVPQCGGRLQRGDSVTFSQDAGCSHLEISGDLSAHDGTVCLIWRADASNCSWSYSGGGMRICSRLSAAACKLNGTTATLSASIDRTCSTLPYQTCDPSAPSCCGAANECALAKPSTSTYICQPKAGPAPLTVINQIDGDDLFNLTTGTPGSCSCEKPKCNRSPTAGTRLFHKGARTYSSDNCAYFSIGGGLESHDGNPCMTWHADPTSCTVTPGGETGECSRINGAKCAYDGRVATLSASVDRKCDTLPYVGCTPGKSVCCGAANTCTLAKGSKTYHMCQPRTHVMTRAGAADDHR